MDRAIPEVSRILTQRQVEAHQLKHKAKLRQVTKTINNDPPLSLQHPFNKAGKQQIVEGRSTRLVIGC